MGQYKQQVNTTDRSSDMGNHQLVLDQRQNLGKREGTSHINKCYLIGLLFSVVIGMLQFGLSIAQWNTVTDAYAVSNNWDEDEKTTK